MTHSQHGIGPKMHGSKSSELSQNSGPWFSLGISRPQNIQNHKSQLSHIARWLNPSKNPISEMYLTMMKPYKNFPITKHVSLKITLMVTLRYLEGET